MGPKTGTAIEKSTVEQSTQPVIAEHSTLNSTFDAEILTGQLAPSSIEMYRRDFAAYVEFAGSFARAIDATTLARWRTNLAQETSKSPNTINRMLSAVKRLMREAAVQGYLTHEIAQAFDHVAGVKVVAMKNRTKTNARTRIEPTDMRVICDLPGTDTLLGIRDTALLATLASGALRVSELAGLTTRQIKLKGTGYVVLVRGKNDIEEREAPLSREAHGHIQRWLRTRPIESDYVFTAFDGRGERATGRPLSAVAIWRTVRKYAAMAGLDDIKPHDFRRFVGTELARTDIRKAQKALGHKRIETTARHYVLDELEVGLTDNLY
ncbi:MAG: tyrosine-type recombinase/integrase [Caldilineaceae bacterium]|nr:tyrosine-type recombinase/integrase [Caldilineaceae bacterium]